MITILSIFRQILMSSMTAAILVCLILLAKQLFKNRLDARWHYYIWFLLLVKLLIPYTPESPISVFNIVTPVAEQVSSIDEFSWLSPDAELLKMTQNTGGSENALDGSDKSIKVNNTYVETEPDAAGTTNTSTLNGIIGNSYSGAFIVIFLVWAAGCCLLVCYIVYLNIRFRKIVGSYNACDEKRINGILEECKKITRVYRRIPVLVLNQTRTPSIYGILNPKLLISDSHIQNLDDDEIRYIILHELSHYKRKDVLVNWVTVLLQILHWFNPIIWYSFYIMRQDCEIACDDKALSYVEGCERKKYGQTIINLLKEAADSSFIPSTAGFMKKNASVKRRITMIIRFKKKSWVRAVVAVALIIAVGLVGIPGAKTIAAKDEKVSFKSEQLAKAIRDALGKDKDSVIYKSELLELKELAVIGTSDISELQACKNLELLQLVSPTDIKTLSSLKNLKNLRRLNIWKLKGNNNLQELRSLTQLEQLEIYDCYDLNNIDVFSKLNRLKMLKIEDEYDNEIGCKLTDNSLTALSKIPGLKELILVNIPITDLKPLQKLTNIISIQILDSQVKDISPLKNLNKIEKLWIGGSKIKDISPITGLRRLKEVALTSSLIEDISPLRDMKNLEDIGLNGNNITNIDALAGLTNLIQLNLAKNKISDIEVLAGLTNLKQLDLAENKISDIGILAGLTNVKELDLSSNRISNIGGISGLTNLERLDLIDNQISDMTVLSSLTNLKWLDLEKNKISDISVFSSLTNLEFLDLGNNQISDISALSRLAKLRSLHSGKNRIIDISALSGLVGLEYLDLGNNQITEVSSLSGLTKLNYLDLRNNKITDVKPLAGYSKIRKGRFLLKGNNITDYSPITDFYSPQDEK